MRPITLFDFKIIFCFRAFVLLVLGAVLSGCTHSEFNLATGQQETYLHSTEKEERIGASVARQLESRFPISDDMAVNERLNRILDRIVAVCDRKELVYTIKVIDEDEVNAVSLPGGYIYMFQGLVDRLETDDQLAAVIAHEVGHVTARHAMKRLQASYGMSLLQVLTIAAEEPALAQGVGAAYQTAFLAYSRQDEFQSDKLSVKYLERAGYDPMAVVEVLKVLQEESRRRAPSRLSYFRTHPHAEERMAVSRREITGELDFESYLDLTGQEKDLY
ncbi:MAG: M48 family metallopeptidase [Candidatus Omnitrophota bacterium]